MAKQKLTVFQKLDKAISGDWGMPQSHNNSYDFSSSNGDNIIYKTDNKEDYLKTKKELQQNAYLNQRWLKANADLSVQAFAGLNNIKLMYRDADLMDSFPEIGAALDILAEESCINNSKNQLLNIYSSSDRIKNVLEELFTNRLDIQITAPMIIRGMCKYGNQFMLLNINNKLGVTGWKQLPVYSMERSEMGVTNPYGMVNTSEVSEEDMKTKFVWIGENNSQVPFRNWQIAHFRLLTDSIYLPYGCIVGDSRIETDNGYKEISNIKIGDKVWTFNVNSQKKELATVSMHMNKGVKHVFNVTTFHNSIIGTDDHKLLTYNKNNDQLEYKEIKDLKIGDLLIIDNEINKQNKRIKIDKTYPTHWEANIKKNMLWWEKTINFIPDYVDEKFARFFGFMLGDGWITQNKYIYFATGEYEKYNVEFISYLKEITNKNVKLIKPFNKENNNYEYSQALVCSKTLSIILKRMGFDGKFNEKRLPSWIFSCSDSIKKAFLDGFIVADGSLFIDKWNILRFNIEIGNEQMCKDLKNLAQSIGFKTSNIKKRNRIGKKTILKNGYEIIAKNESFYFYYYESFNKQEKKYDLQTRLEKGFKTEKIRNIEYCGMKETYDITVDNNNSNFFANGIVTHNCSYLHKARRHWRMLSLMEDMMLIYRLERSIERRVYKIYVGAIDDADVQSYVQEIANNFKRTPIIDPMTGQVDLRKNLLSVDQDIFIPVRDQNAPTPIDTLAAAQNLTAMDDIKFVQNKLFTALGIPKTFLNYEEGAGDGKNLALMDIRFTRRINRIQQAFLMELTKVATIHLYLLGFHDELTNFSLSMNNPSTQAEQLEIENIQKKISAMRDAVADPGNGIPIMSATRALKEIMKWSDKDIQSNLEEIRLEKALAAELEKTTQIIKKTGLFDNVDRIYGEPGAEYQEQQAQEGQGDDMGGPPMGGGGGGPIGDMGGGDMPPMEDDGMGAEVDGLGDVGADENGEIAGAEGEMPMESKDNKGTLLTESGKINTNFFINENKIQKNAVFERMPILDKALMINEEFDKMLKSLNDIKE